MEEKRYLYINISTKIRNKFDLCAGKTTNAKSHNHIKTSTKVTGMKKRTLLISKSPLPPTPKQRVKKF